MRLRYYAGILLFFWISFSAFFVSAAPADASVKITGIRWGRTIDAVTGTIKVRLVLETSAPVEFDKFIASKPNWRLVVTLRGVNADNLAMPQSPDKSVVDKMSAVKSVKDTTHIILDLPQSITEDQYKVFTLKADPKAKRPFRVVIDVEKAIPPSELKFSTGLNGKIVAIDPGHGGSDPGAVSVRGFREKQLNLTLAMQVKAILERSGAKVLMTRETDVDVSSPDASDRDELRARTLVGNNNRADIFISIHHNSSASSDLNGTTTYYYRKTLFDAVLAQSIQDAMVQAGRLTNIGVRTANFFVVKNTTMPAALLEIGFLSNPQDEQLLTNPAFQQKMAQAIVAGIDQFFGQAAKMRGEQ